MDEIWSFQVGPTYAVLDVYCVEEPLKLMSQ
jgi:hypothetical protein